MYGISRTGEFDMNRNLVENTNDKLEQFEETKDKVHNALNCYATVSIKIWRWNRRSVAVIYKTEKIPYKKTADYLLFTLWLMVRIHHAGSTWLTQSTKYHKDKYFQARNTM